MNIEQIKELIDKTFEIEKNFYKGDSPFRFKSPNWNTTNKKSFVLKLDMIYKDPEFVEWRTKLLYELSQLKQNDFIRKLTRELERFNGVGERERFKNVESKLKVLKENLCDYIPLASDIELDDERISEKELISTMIRILLNLQRNNHYDLTCDENTINDYIRDLLGERYQVKDQTRQGVSEGGDDAGEVDIQLLYNNLPIVMIEGLILDSVVKEKLYGHMNKIILNYDPNGCPYVILLIYYKGANLQKFHTRMIENLSPSKYQFPFEQATELENVDTGYGELKHVQTVLNRNGQKVRVHIFTANIN